MNKKILISLIVVILIGTGVWMITKPRVEKPIEVLPPITEKPIKVEGVASAWSVAETEEMAAAEIISAIKKEIGESPDILIVYPAGYESTEKLVNEIRALVPETKIFGKTSFGGMVSDEFLFGKPKAVVALGIKRTDITWGIAALSAEEISPEEAAKRAVLEAIKDAGKKETERPAFLLMAPTFGIEEPALRGVQEILGKDMPLFGAHAVEPSLTGVWRVFANEKIYQKGVAVAVIYTDLALGYFREEGYEATEQYGTVTAADGYRVIEIDGSPAAEVYNEWLGGILTEEIKAPEKVELLPLVIKTALTPLGKEIKVGEEMFYAPSMPVNILPDRSMIFEIEMEKGDRVVLLRGDWEILLNRLITTPEKAMEMRGIKKEKILFTISSFCGGSLLVIPQTEWPKMPKLFQGAIGKTPYVNIFDCAQQMLEPQIGKSVNTSLGFGIVIFAER